LTPKGSLNLIPGGSSLFARFDANLGRPVQRTLSDGQSIPVPVQNTVLPVPQDRRLDFSLNHRPAGQRFSGHVAAAKEVLRELVEGLNYFLCPIVFLGAFAPQRKPANLLVTTLAVIFLVVLVQFASRSGYVSSRHVIILVCFACFVAARGGGVLVEWLARAWNAGVARVLQPRLVEEPSETRPNVCAIALFGVAVICCMPRAIGRFHPSRQAHVVAGRWLLEHAATGSMVLDSRGWASLYSGLPSYDYNGARLAFENPNLAYVVVEGSELTDDRPRGQTLRYLLGLAGQMVAEFPGEAPSNESVKIFAWHADRIEGGMAQGAMKAN
jgi:hypothetical protein